jgi:hypothetical protein
MDMQGEKTMGTCIGVLNQVLVQLIHVHQQLLDLSREKKEVLIQGSIHRLAEVVRQEGQLVREVARLEDERERTLLMIEQTTAAALNERPSTMQQIIQRLPESEERQELIKNRQQLLDLIERINRCNQINQQLIQQSLTYVRHTLSSAAGLDFKNPGLYKPPQNKEGSNHSSDAAKYRPANSGMFNKKI